MKRQRLDKLEPKVRIQVEAEFQANLQRLHRLKAAMAIKKRAAEQAAESARRLAADRLSAKHVASRVTAIGPESAELSK